MSSASRGMRVAVAAAMLLLSALDASARDIGAGYGFPIEDPYLATVLGTPAALRAPLPADLDVEHRSLVLFDDREIPAVFWTQNDFSYSLARQDGRAPLIFLIAGTGARYDSGKMAYLQAVFHQAGYHVVNVSSPTHPEFIVSGSSSSVPGYMKADVRDLYVAMQHIYAEIHSRVEVSDFYLSGYSLGGSQSAFLAQLDSHEGAFKFKKVLLLNPSVDLFTSVNILDSFLSSVPGGARGVGDAIHDVFRRVTNYFHRNGRESIDTELLYKIAEEEELSGDELRTLIGVAFRISSSEMLFSSDVMTGSHIVVEPETRLGVTTPLLPYFKFTARWTWLNYLDDVLLPYWQRREPGLTRESMIQSVSMVAIEDYLKRATHVAVLHNADDLILGPGDLEWLERTFGDRATIYPVGGHCGNLMYRDNVERMLEFFAASPGSGE